jgi:hypothetical protein
VVGASYLPHCGSCPLCPPEVASMLAVAPACCCLPLIAGVSQISPSAKADGSSLSSPLPLSPHLTSFSQLQPSSCLCCCSSRLAVVSSSSNISGEADSTSISSLASSGIRILTPPTEGRRARLRRPDNPSDDVLVLFHLLHSLEHRIQTNYRQCHLRSWLNRDEAV